jgi:peptidoglycan/LPS O-acetylase OafA/YrhL
VNTINTTALSSGLRGRFIALVRRPSDRRIAYLNELLRLAIILVVVSHCFGLFTLIFANCGVILFFFYSGYLMDQALVRDRRVAPFVIRRTFRILLMYWVSILLVFASGPVWTIRDVLANATFLAPALHSERMLGVYWTLYIEVLFYTVVPFVRFFGERSIKLAPYVLIGIFCTIYADYGAVNDASFYILFCFGGMQIGAWSRGQNSRLQLFLVFSAICVSAILLPTNGMYFGLAPLFCMVLFLTAMWHSWSFRPLEFIGDVSYSWYLLHALIGFLTMNSLSAAGAKLWVATLIGILISIAASMAAFLLIEQPMIQLGQFAVGRMSTIQNRSAIL